MARKLACRLGRHDWTTHVEEGESYKVCAACGKLPREPRQPGEPTAHAFPHGEPDGDVLKDAGPGYGGPS
jgi:hypothetical protein